MCALACVGGEGYRATPNFPREEDRHDGSVHFVLCSGCEHIAVAVWNNIKIISPLFCKGCIVLKVVNSNTAAVEWRVDGRTQRCADGRTCDNSCVILSTCLCTYIYYMVCMSMCMGESKCWKKENPREMLFMFLADLSCLIN